jgi:serine protease Do
VDEVRESVVEVRSGGRGSGAGSIWPGDGLVLTNHHVVSGGRRGRRREANARVALRDGRTFEAEIVKGSRTLDLALLRPRGDTRGLPAVTVGDSDALRVGELVYAVGHPWGSPGAVTAGVVSGLDASVGWPHGGSAARYVRSDVTLAPGNSGGPLLNAAGEVVGINAMIFGRTALSVPANTASAWVAGTEDGRPRLGVGVVPVSFPASGRPAEGDAWGLAVSSVEGGSPADAAGLLVGDVLLGLAGAPPGDVESFQEVLSRGDAVSLRVLRGGTTVIVEVPPRAPGRAA